MPPLPGDPDTGDADAGWRCTPGGPWPRWRRAAMVLWLAWAVLMPAASRLPAVSAREGLQLELAELAQWLERADHQPTAEGIVLALPGSLQQTTGTAGAAGGGCLMLSRLELQDLRQRLSLDLRHQGSRAKESGQRPGWRQRYAAQLAAAELNLSRCQTIG